MTEDFAHRLQIGSVRDGERLHLIADEAERSAVAERLGLDRIERFEAHVAMSRDGDRVGAKGRIVARLDQRCVATGEPVRAHVDEPFDIRFVPEPSPGRPDEEIELRAEECDLVFHDGAAVDLGAALADTLALSVNPYPRSSSAEAALKGAGVISEEEAGPFAALAQLKQKMEGNQP